MALEVARGAKLDEHAKLLKRGVVIDTDRPMERLRAIIASELEALNAILPDLELEEAEQRQQSMEATKGRGGIATCRTTSAPSASSRRP
jgi:hypothetical protein